MATARQLRPGQHNLDHSGAREHTQQDNGNAEQGGKKTTNMAMAGSTSLLIWGCLSAVIHALEPHKAFADNLCVRHPQAVRNTKRIQMI
jgi:hypothetical protein